MTEPIKQETLVEAIIDRRNFYQIRYVEKLVDIIFWKKMLARVDRKSLPLVWKDYKDKLEAKKIESSQDELLIESFDELLKQHQNAIDNEG